MSCTSIIPYKSTLDLFVSQSTLKTWMKIPLFFYEDQARKARNDWSILQWLREILFQDVSFMH